MGRAKLLALAGICYFLFHAVPKAGEPLKVFEWEYYSAAENAAATGVPVEYGTGLPAVEHPPLYVYLLAGVMKLSGVSVPAARLTGMALALLTCAPLFLLARSLGAGWPAFAGAAALYLTSPAVIQGSGIIGAADTGLLPALLLFFCWALLELRRRPAFFWPAAGLFCLCLWAKFTTSLALPVFFLGWRVIERDPAGFRRELALFAAGAAGFLLTWGAYCALVPGFGYFAEPLLYPFPQLTAGLKSGSVARKVLAASGELLRVAAWTTPFLLFAAAWRPSAGSPDKERQLRGLAALAFALFAGYTAVRGTGGGFPKYQFPAMALFCLAAGSAAARELPALTRRGALGAALLCSAAFLYHRLLLGDAVLYAQELLRSAAVHGARSSAWPAAAWAALYLAPFAAAWPAAARLAGWGAGRAFFLVSLSFAIGYNISQNALQLSAGYSTTYAYGTAGAGEAAAFLRASTAPEDPVIGAFETLYAAGNKRALLMPAEAWNEAGAFLDYLERVRPAAVVCGLGTNTAEQQAMVFDSPRVRAALSAGYEERVFGAYAVWLKKERKK